MKFMDIGLFTRFTNVGYITAFLLSLTLALLLLARSKRVQARLFASISVATSLWIVCNFLADNTTTISAAMFWTRIAIVFPILIGPLFWNFSNVFPLDGEDRLDKRFLYSMLSTIPLLILVPTRFNVESVEFIEFGISFEPGFLYSFFSVYLVGFLVASFYKLYKKFRTSIGIARSQLIVMVSGIILTFITGITATLFLPILGYSSLSFIGPISSPFYIIATSYSLLRHRLFGIKFVLGRTIYIIVIALVPYSWFFMIYFVQTELWGNVYSRGSLISGFFISILFVYFLLFARNRLTDFINEKIINPGFDPQREIDHLTQKLSETLDLDLVMSEVLSTFANTVAPETMGVLAFDRESKEIVRSKGVLTANISVNEALKISKVLSNLPRDIGIKSELELKEGTERHPKVLSLLEKFNVEVGSVMSDKKGIVGLILLGPKKTERLYTAQETDFIQNVCLNTSVAMGRALLHNEVQKFGKKLQKEVEEATKKLQIQNEKLKHLDKLKDDLISIAGHELRTPATVAKGNLHLLKKKMQSKSPKEREKYLQRAIDAIEREAELVSILLEASRIGKDTLDLIVEEIDFVELSKAATEDHLPQAEKKGLKLTFEQPKKRISKIYADKTRLREVTDNLITNAIKYTNEGVIKVWIEEKDKKVWFHIKDTGVGIPQKEIPRLFQKFYRVKNYTSSTKKLMRPGGTGLGLYVSKNIVKRHGGDLTVESEVGKGSTFSFYIPLSFKGNLGAVKDLPREQKEPDLFRVMGLDSSGVEKKSRK